MKEHLRRLMHSPALLASAVIILLLFYFNGYTDLIIHERYRDGQIKVACVGDSITYGYGIPNQPKKSYPDLLDDMLGDGFNVRNYGNIRVTVQPDGDQPYTGTYTYPDSVEYQADILIFMLGSNDAKTINWQDEEKFREAYITLLDSYLEGEKKPRVYLCTPAAAFCSEKGSAETAVYDIQPDVVEKIAQIVREISKERDYGLIDIHSVTEGKKDLYSRDGVHPNSDGAKAIADEVYRIITA